MNKKVIAILACAVVTVSAIVPVFGATTTVFDFSKLEDESPVIYSAEKVDLDWNPTTFDFSELEDEDDMPVLYSGEKANSNWEVNLAF